MFPLQRPKHCSAVLLNLHDGVMGDIMGVFSSELTTPEMHFDMLTLDISSSFSLKSDFSQSVKMQNTGAERA